MAKVNGGALLAIGENLKHAAIRTSSATSSPVLSSVQRKHVRDAE